MDAIEHVAIRLNQPLPDGSGFVNSGGDRLRRPSLFNPMLAPDGHVVFAGAISGPTVDGSNDSGLFLYDPLDRGLAVVYREGDQTPDAQGNLFSTDSFKEDKAAILP